MSVKYTLPADAPQEKLDEVNGKFITITTTTPNSGNNAWVADFPSGGGGAYAITGFSILINGNWYVTPADCTLYGSWDAIRISTSNSGYLEKLIKILLIKY